MSEAQETLELSEAQIAVHWREEDYITPPASFIAQANMTDAHMYERLGLEHFPECFKEYADLLSWYQYWHTTLDTSDAPCWKWFVGGKINAAYNCVDRHLAQYKNKAAILYVPEPENEPHVAITYQELYVRVNEMAALLRDFAGIKAGDRVTHGAGPARDHAGLRAPGRHSLGGLRWLQWTVVRRTHCRLGQSRPDN
jgi:acetyl-CoA synthetase